jgi:S1-C subfamily serine protease
VSAGTSAADAGLTKGDVILKWGDKPMEGAADLMERLRDHEPGDVVKLTILRDGKEMIVDVTLKASKK